MTAFEQIRRDEGLRSTPYPDVSAHPDATRLTDLWQTFLTAGGTVAVGYGRNLTRNPLQHHEALFLLENDVQQATAEVLAKWPWTATLNDPRRAVLVNMGYNLGITGLSTFRKMFAAMEHQQWATAADELLDSRYAKQVGPRAARLAEQLRTGQWQ